METQKSPAEGPFVIHNQELLSGRLGVENTPGVGKSARIVKGQRGGYELETSFYDVKTNNPLGKPRTITLTAEEASQLREQNVQLLREKSGLK